MYNGWSNYETWAVGLWLDNDEGQYRTMRALAEEARSDNEDEDDPEGAKEAAASDLADKIKDHVEGAVPDLEGPYCDLLGAALSEVDWEELGNHYIEED